ncbi:MAG TPA: hypothetical protein VFP53_06050 [Sphingomicrobium sp.]|nr:hypothetical protein [Sphingomicrobium sp.]
MNFKACLTVMATLGCASVAPAQSPPAGVRAAPAAVMHLEPYRRTVAVRVEANGRKGLFAFDSASGITLVTPAFAKAVGCTPWGEQVGYSMTGHRYALPRCDNVRLTIDGTPLTVPVAEVLDPTELFAPGATPIDGAIALDVFDGKVVTIDAAGGQLIIESPASLAERIRDARELPLRIARESGGVALSTFVQVPTARGPLSFELDTGNGGTLLVHKAYASALGLDPDAKWPARASFEVAPGIKAEGVIFVKDDLDLNGNLGMPFLKDWIVTLDLKNSRMWIQPTKSVPPPGMGVPPELPKP